MKWWNICLNIVKPEVNTRVKNQNIIVVLSIMLHMIKNILIEHLNIKNMIQ